MSDPTPIEAARAALAAYDAPRCGVKMDWIVRGLPCNLPTGHVGRHEHMSEHEDVRAAAITPDHLRAALAAIDAAELRGHTRAVNETAIASIHKAVAAERAAVVAYLRVGAAIDPRSPLAGYADAIERGDHREDAKP